MSTAVLGITGPTRRFNTFTAACLFMLVVKLNSSPLVLFNILLIVVLAATLFSTFSLIIVCIVKIRAPVMGVGQVLTMPRLFASHAIYPTAIMPGWLKTLSSLNPFTYVLDVLLTFMLAYSTSAFGVSLDYTFVLRIVSIVSSRSLVECASRSSFQTMMTSPART